MFSRRKPNVWVRFGSTQQRKKKLEQPRKSELHRGCVVTSLGEQRYWQPQNERAEIVTVGFQMYTLCHQLSNIPSWSIWMRGHWNRFCRMECQDPFGTSLTRSIFYMYGLVWISIEWERIKKYFILNCFSNVCISLPPIAFSKACSSISKVNHDKENAPLYRKKWEKKEGEDFYC